MTRKQAYWRLSLILFIFLLIGVAHTIWLPLHKSPDEQAHFRYIRFIIQNKRVPLTFEEREIVGYRANQPALYHIVTAALAGWSDNDEPPYPKFAWQSPRFDIARELLDTKRLANTEDELMPFRGTVWVWHVARLVGLWLSMGTIVVAFFTALEIYAQKYWLALVSAAIISFVPTFVFISSALSDDALVGLLVGLYFWMLIKIIKGDNRLRTYLALGLFMGLAVTAKNSTIILPVEVVGVFSYLAWAFGWGWLTWLKRVALVAVTAMLVSSWWYSILIIYFNDIEQFGLFVGILKPLLASGVNASEQYVAYVLSGGTIGIGESFELMAQPWSDWALNIYQTFWTERIEGVALGVMAQILMGLVLVISIVGLTRAWRVDHIKKIWVALFAFHLLLFFVFPVLRHAIQGNVTQTGQGRHVLFPIATMFPLLITYGWQDWLPAKIQRRLALALVGGLLCWSMVQLIRVINYPIYYLPVRTTAEVNAQISHRVDQSFGESLVLLGYDTELAPADNALKIKLYWQSPTYPDEDYKMTIALAQDGEPRFSWSTYPVNGRYPTRIWESWETIRDDVWLPLPDLSPGDYQLQLQLNGSQAALPVNNDDVLTLGNVTVSRGNQLQPDIQFSLSTGDRQINAGVSLWQAERYRMFDLPEYQPRMQIAFVWQGDSGSNERISWLLVDPQGQVYPATPITDHFGYFWVGPDWLSGDYRLRMELWRDDAVIASQESAPIVTIVNEKPRMRQPPPISHPIGANFANRIELLGYDLPVRSIEGGSGVPVVLYWQGLRTMAKSYTVFAKLLDQEHKVWGSTDRLPADGYPTIYWLENEIVIDGFQLSVDPAAPDGVYWLNVGLYEEVNGSAVSLPLINDDQPGEITSVTFGPIKIGGPPPGVVITDPSIEHGTNINFDHIIALRGYDSPELIENKLKIRLFWESLSQATKDYTVFIHIQNDAGDVVAQMDRLVANNIYPTSLWSPGEIISDEMIIWLPDELPAGNYKIIMGLYDFNTNLRLPVGGSNSDSFVLDEFVR
jgi:4-amino-4-deoxy-L-arabinose transferase-like glycosyltransferase